MSYGRPFTEDESKIVLTMVAEGRSWKAIADAIGRNPEVVRQSFKRWFCGVIRKPRCLVIKNQWTHAEDVKLRDMVARNMLSKDMLPHLPGRSAKAINFRVHNLGLAHVRDMSRRWTDEEHARLTELVRAGLCAKSCARHFPDRTLLSVKQRCTAIRKQERAA